MHFYLDIVVIEISIAKAKFLQVGFGEDFGIYRNTEDTEDCQFTKSVSCAMTLYVYAEEHPWDQVRNIQPLRL